MRSSFSTGPLLFRTMNASTLLKKIQNRIYRSGILQPPVAPDKRIVIMYHGIDRVEDRRFNTRFFSADHLREQLIFFKKHFHIANLDDFRKGVKPDPNKPLMTITFDDGYRNNFLYAAPIFEELQVPATFYVTGLNQTPYNILWADLVDIATFYLPNTLSVWGAHFQKNSAGKFADLKNYIKDRPIMNTPAFEELQEAIKKQIGDIRERPELEDYWRLMSDEEIRQLGQSKHITIGSHGFFHNNLGNIPFEAAADELRRSSAYLQGLTGYPIRSVAYPSGSYSRELVDEAERLGFEHQMAVNYLFKEDHSDPRIENRLGLYPPIGNPAIHLEIYRFE